MSYEILKRMQAANRAGASFVQYGRPQTNETTDMSYRVADIKHETSSHWVLYDRKDGSYTVYKKGLTHSTADSSYRELELAVYRCNYLTERGL